MACWRRGLTHIPFKDTFMGSNPVQVTTKKISIDVGRCFFCIFDQKYCLGLILSSFGGYLANNQRLISEF